MKDGKEWMCIIVPVPVQVAQTIVDCPTSSQFCLDDSDLKNCTFFRIQIREELRKNAKLGKGHRTNEVIDNRIVIAQSTIRSCFRWWFLRLKRRSRTRRNSFSRKLGASWKAWTKKHLKIFAANMAISIHHTTFERRSQPDWITMQFYL